MAGFTAFVLMALHTNAIKLLKRVWLSLKCSRNHFIPRNRFIQTCESRESIQYICVYAKSELLIIINQIFHYPINFDKFYQN